MTLTALVLLLAQSAPAVPAAAPPVKACDKPVIMVVAGPTHDRARMLAYGKAIADSGLYREQGGYYVNVPQEIARFEGEAPTGYTTVMVRFPCLANAKAFWNSKVYQERIKPLRLNPSAGDYIVTVYPEAPVREDMRGKVGDNAYRAPFITDALPQPEPHP